MSQATASVVIIGAGVMGASIACHLALRGCPDVLILEKEPTEISGTRWIGPRFFGLRSAGAADGGDGHAG